ncbi:MAG: alpha/beta hydrolase [Ornithinimicrobium sp.]
MAPELHTTAGPVRYAVTGPSSSGAPDLVLIHGWCCERSSMVTLREEFGSEHRVVEIDLRGHGGSLDAQDDGSMGVGHRRTDHSEAVPEPLTQVRIEDYASDIWAICKQARLHRPVLIGHSMGALVALAVLAARPLGAHAPIAGVLLDPAPIVNPDAKSFWGEVAEHVRRDVSGSWRREFAQTLFLKTDRASRIALIEAIARTRTEVAAAAATAMADFDGEDALSRVDRPLLVIHANTAERQVSTVARSAGVELTTGQTVGAGHFHHLEVPEQVMPMIRQWMKLTLGG